MACTSLDGIAGNSDAAGMVYPGGKNGSGVYQTIINRMPPHAVYIEPFLGSGAILRMKRPALRNIGIDRDPDALKQFEALIAGHDDAAGATVINGDAFAFLSAYRFTGHELVYCDPPYLHDTRGRHDLYRHEWSQADLTYGCSRSFKPCPAW